MVQVKSWSLGVNTITDIDVNGKPIIEPVYTIKNFKHYGLRCRFYIFMMKLLEDYIEVDCKDVSGEIVYNRHKEYVDVDTHVVKVGDTLWGIVKKYYDIPTYYYANVIFLICVKNNIKSDVIHVGQRIKLI